MGRFGEETTVASKPTRCFETTPFSADACTTEVYVTQPPTAPRSLDHIALPTDSCTTEVYITPPPHVQRVPTSAAVRATTPNTEIQEVVLATPSEELSTPKRAPVQVLAPPWSAATTNAPTWSEGAITNDPETVPGSGFRTP